VRNRRRFGLLVPIAAALLVAIVLQWSHVVRRREVDRAEVSLEQATLIRMSLARAALARARQEVGDPTAGQGDALEQLARAQLALRDLQVGRPGSVGVRAIPQLQDTTLRPLVERLASDVLRYRTLLDTDSMPDEVAERVAYGAVAARADSIFFLANLSQLQRRHRDDQVHVVTLAVVVFTILLFTGVLALVLARADTASARNAALRTLAEALAAARTPRDVARATHRVVGEVLGSQHGATGLLIEQGTTFELIETFGYRAGGLLTGMRFPNEPQRPVTEALASQQVLCLGSMGDYRRRAPLQAAEAEALAIRAIAVLPLVAAGESEREAMGAITFDFEEPREFDEGDRQFLDAVASVAAQAMARALAAQDVESARAQALGERERLEAILDRLPVGVIVMDEEHAVVHQNAAVARHLGHAVTDGANVWSNAQRLDGTPYADSDHPLARALRDAVTIEQELSQLLRPDGTIVILRFSIAPVHLDGGRRRAVVATVEDVSDLHRAQVALAESEANFRMMAEQLPVGIYRQGADGRSEYINPRIAELYGSNEPLDAQTWLRVVHPDDRDRLVAETAAARASGVARARYQFRVLRATDQQVRHLVLDTVYLRDENGAAMGAIGVAQDVTERESLEAQLRQAQKMEAVGRLAGGIAHDFNNLLTVIGGVADLLLRNGTLSASDRADVQQVRESAKRAAELTRQLLAFSRQQSLSIGRVDVAHIVEQSQKFIRRVIGEHITVSVDGAAQLPPVLADPGALEQVLMNLVVNARDAMPDGGELHLRVSACHADPGAVEPRLRVGRGFVCMEVTDTGTGISPEIRSRIFDPFFTTKEVGRGTGLGLSMVYGLIAQMDGWIEVQSMMGAGTTFLIYLPIAGPGVRATETGASSDVSARGSETILLVEDDASVRRLAHRMLATLGYVVLEAPDAASALQLADGHPHLDILVTDVVLPGRSGASLADELRLARPGLRVLFMSGYTSDDALRRRLAEGVPFLAKPYTPSALASRVRAVLDEPVATR